MEHTAHALKNRARDEEGEAVVLELGKAGTRDSAEHSELVTEHGRTIIVNDVVATMLRVAQPHVFADD